MTLGELINNYLNEHDMSMRKFASLAGVSHAYISNIVNEKTGRGRNPVPTMTVYKGIAKAMGISVEELIYRVETGEIAWGKQNEMPDTHKGAGHREEEYEELQKNVKDFVMDSQRLTPENFEKIKEYLALLLLSQKDQDGK